MKSFVCILFLFIIFSCSSPEKSKGKVIKVEFDESSEILFSDIFEQVDYLPLETTDSSLIGNINRLRLFGNRMCFLCDKSVLVFNLETGQADLKISKFGRDPESYQSLYDVFINSAGDLEVLDMNGQKIQRYDTNGVFQETLKLPFRSFSFIKQGEKDYWFYNNNMISERTKSRLLHFDSKEGKIQEEYFPVDSHLARFFFVVEGNNFVSRKNDLLYFACPSDKIYSLQPFSEPVVKYTVDFGRHAVPREFYRQNFTDIAMFAGKADKNEYVYFVNNFCANENYIQLSFFLNKKAFWNIYDELQNINYGGGILQDDLNSLRRFHLNHVNTFFVMDENYLYFLISADQFLQMCQENSKFSEMINKYNIDDQSNPLLVKCKLKSKE